MNTNISKAHRCLIRNVKKHMTAQELTGLQVAKRAKMHYSTLSRILNGHNTPSVTVQWRLARALNVEPEDLLA